MPLLLTVALFLLTTCSHDAARNPDQIVESTKGVERNVQLDIETLVRYLKDDLKKSEEKILTKNCSENLNSNIFCPIYNNIEVLETAVTKRKLKLKSRRKEKRKTLRAKVKNKNIQNWKELKAAEVNALIRGLNSSRPKDIEIIEKKLEQENECPLNIAIALGAYLEDNLPDRRTYENLANLYFKGGKCPSLTPQDQEIVLSRAGLFYFLSQKWELAEEAFRLATAAPDVYNGRSLYWLYQTQLQREKNRESNETLTTLRTKYPFSFHTLVALTNKEEDPGDILSKDLKLTYLSSQTPLLNQLLSDIELLKKHQKEEAARKVLDWAIALSDSAEPEMKLYLADLKGEQGDYVSKISLLSEVLYKNPDLVTKPTLESYFPKLYFPFFEKNDVGLDPLFLISIARQESAFNPNARSSAKAKGLLQVLTSTARRFFPKKKINLYDPETNVTVGARYLQELLTRTNNQVPLALAAYNAGEGRLAEWLKRYQTTNPILFMDIIPYRETREYVSSILRNYYWYRKLHSEKQIKKLEELFIAVRQEPAKS